MLSSAAHPAAAQTAPSTTAGNDQESVGLKEKILGVLPDSISDGLDFNVWGWAADAQQFQLDQDNVWDGELSLGITKSFDQRAAITVQGNLIDADGTRWVELEKAYASVLLCENGGTVVTVGKFNADFGVEERDFWDRTTGTTSLLFGAQPQDLVGLMITQPLGQTGLTLRPFLSADFQGQFYFEQSPSAGLTAEYQPTRNLDLAVTNWVGPGLVAYGGRHIPRPYYEDYDYSTLAGANWQGPNLYAQSRGTLYFLEPKAVWQVRPDLNLSAEYLISSTNSSREPASWQGCLIMGDFDLTDRCHLFARWSYLEDPNWLVTGTRQSIYELSGGFGYFLTEAIELRLEYRHDCGSATGNLDSASAHLTFTF